MLSSEKYAIVESISKKANLDPNKMENYRSLSNLSFLSNLIERLVFQQLTIYLYENMLMPVYQSAYLQHHSTEAAVMKIISDVYDATDTGMFTLLTMLDLSAAFDTVDYQTLILRLNRSFNIGGTVLSWLESFLTDRSQTVTSAGK